jgi:hypothetical protein
MRACAGVRTLPIWRQSASEHGGSCGYLLESFHTDVRWNPRKEFSINLERRSSAVCLLQFG